MRLLRTVPIAMLAVLALAGCGNATANVIAPPVISEVRVSGSGTAMPLVQLLAKEYAKSHPDVRFTFEQGTNSGGAIKGVQTGVLDLAVVNRKVKPAEATKGIAYVPLARDAVAFAVGPGIRLTNISTADVRRIYGGRIVDWSSLGQPAGPLVVLDRDADESARKLVLLPVLKGQAVRARTTELAKASEMAEALASTPRAFGYTAVGYLKAKDVQGVRLLSLDGTAPTADAVADGRYPWALTLAVVHRVDGSPALQNFVRYAAGQSAADLLKAYGYAPPKG